MQFSCLFIEFSEKSALINCTVAQQCACCVRDTAARLKLWPWVRIPEVERNSSVCPLNEK